MMTFCPTCGTLLMVEYCELTRLRYACQTCPYVYMIDRKIVKEHVLETKEVDDVLGGDEAWANVDRTEVSCPKCDHGQAYFMQVQTRSADEPMTIFYKCCKCANRWKD
uniref:DNA-directed RNA polymerase subunit n=1 Tax=Pyramimonas obovata TaxID=1411642 RepID=A0A7S0RJ62_9CHLO|mmetsp:Transcript_35394/g.77304  ORF Transcript_35394/g.77304 Transcript_35394/m.77304 type:complete len:108 (+) Transcript_35394:292-615(+)